MTGLLTGYALGIGYFLCMLRLRNWKEWWMATGVAWGVNVLGWGLIASKSNFGQVGGFLLVACSTGAILGLLVEATVAAAKGVYRRVSGKGGEDRADDDQDHSSDDTQNSDSS